MMVLIRIFILFLCIGFAKCQSPKDSSTLEIKYKYTYLIDTLDKNNTLSEPMVLLTNGQKSIYYGENHKIFMDDFRKQLQDAVKTGKVIDPSSNVSKARSSHSVYKDNNLIYISAPLGGTRYIFEIDEPIWKIYNKETKDISGYKCVKAITKINNRTYTAWFTYDIPISDGPYKFKGLPGLVLKLNEENNYISFDLLSLKKATLSIEFKKEKGVIVTKEQYLAKRKEYLDDPSQGRINTPEYRKIVEEGKKRHNNFLEN
jgi:GLPGLI family protein